ncbi:hypothetical protein DH09_12120 [Bacillaceae bacterium JMAK1]|nr:hypothetical protein DH09_12120 [Bacillaceae bacterium JMAK1]
MEESKIRIVEHHRKTIEFVQSLHAVSEDTWRMELGAGQWSVAEVIGHLIPWDEFVLQKRIPYLFTNEQLPKGPEATTLNNASAFKSRNEEKSATIRQFVSVRSNLLNAIHEISNSRWKEELLIGQTRLQLYDYFNGLAEHDLHHFAQVKRVLQNN